jgi:hypothetical protein
MMAEGDADEGQRRLEQSVALTEGLISPTAIRATGNLASLLGDIGQPAASRTLHERCLALASRLGARRDVRWATAERVEDLYLTGEWDEAWQAPGGVAHVGICTSARYALAAVAAGAPIRSFAAVVGWFHDTSTVARSTAAELAWKNGCNGRTQRSSDWWCPEKPSLSRRTRRATTGPECSSRSTTTPTPHAAPCRRGRTPWPR